MSWYKDEMLAFTVKRITYAIEKYAISTKISPNALQVNGYVEDEAHYMLIRLSAHIMSDRMQGKTIIYPASTWDHFKQDYMPAWFIKRYPVKYKEHTTNFRVCYPHFNLNHEHLGRGYVDIYESRV